MSKKYGANSLFPEEKIPTPAEVAKTYGASLNPNKLKNDRYQ